MDNYSISIKNCNSIDQADITITKGCLNIKYGPNGIGKSTIAKAIVSSSKADSSLEALLPFKHRSEPDGHTPEVSGTDDINNTLIFDDTYVSQFVFQPDEVVKNSFDIFINTDEFKTAMNEIEGLFSEIKKAFDDNQELTDAISDLRELRDAFNVTKSGAISKASKGFKAFGSGNKIANIPDHLQPFEDFLRSEQPSSWISWQAKGNAFIDLSENCPYCSSNLQKGNKKDTARQVAKEYDSKAVEHLSKLQQIIERLGQYFEHNCRASLNNITKSKTELSPEEKNFLAALRGDIETLISKLEGLRSISFFSLRDVEQVEDEVNKLKIDLSLLKNLESEETKGIIDPINEKLDGLVSQIGTLKGKINKHKAQIQKTIEENQDHINGFLVSAGYKYAVQIQSEQDSYKMKLIHQDHKEHLESASQNLSYGEKNAFALVLFMHQMLREKPDLAILDDPVSSFDKTKKFAILHELFRGKTSLRDSTTLMLTHDIEPAIDVIKSINRLFQHPKPSVYFLSAQSGTVSEQQISASDIKTFAQICHENIYSIEDEIIKCIYLRRHFEILNNLGLEYNLLSSLLHARELPTKHTENGSSEMTDEEISNAKSNIAEHIAEFDYAKILSLISNQEELIKRFLESEVGYDKIQLYRVFSEAHKAGENPQKDDNIIRKFVNESFHIENEYVMQLNPHKFDNVPEYVVQECESMMLQSQQ